MDAIKTLVLTGYRTFELGVFQDKDPKVAVIKKSLKMTLLPYVENGLEWVLTSGQLGTEIWGAEVVSELKEDYPELRLGLIFPFADFGQQWNENNQQKLALVKSLADFVDSTSHKPYQNPQQLRNHTKFLLEHSGGCVILFDEEAPGKPEFFYRDAKQFQERFPYEIIQITFEDLQNSLENPYE
ncbi:DUF1273 domain-containing protein [Enterococcus sp. HY326]|uniref:DUF1273 domain-containing protein n=1 Tax=Enterococcus sp. HY326 TaxID=2971265 RepID=UPI00223FE93A|nr:DUF1273 domain-containing protein [Enterococcus sp. HY326]